MNQLKRYIIIGTIFIIISGTLSHFFYEWSNNNFVVGLFSPINESTWEHMKLVFFPMLLFSLIANSKLKEIYPCITSSLLFGILIGTFLIPIIFYTYTGILGYNVFVLDLITFYICCYLFSFYCIQIDPVLSNAESYNYTLYHSMCRLNLFCTIHSLSSEYSFICHTNLLSLH